MIRVTYLAGVLLAVSLAVFSAAHGMCQCRECALCSQACCGRVEEHEEGVVRDVTMQTGCSCTGAWTSRSSQFTNDSSTVPLLAISLLADPIASAPALFSSAGKAWGMTFRQAPFSRLSLYCTFQI